MNQKTQVKSPIFSPDIYDRNLGQFAEREEYKEIKRQIERIGRLVDGLEQVRNNRDPFKTPDQITVEYGQRYEEALGDARRSADYISDQLVQAQERAYNDMLAQTKLDRVPDNAQEIRGVMRSLPEDERKAFLDRAVEQGDSATVAAILNAQPELSGLRGGMIQQAEKFFIDKYAPNYRTEIEAIDKAGDAAKMAFDSFKRSADDMRDPFGEAEAKRKKQEADEAQRVFNDALSKN